jgi:uncharacterized membrane protein YsdA (DUF1294 family)
VGTWIAAGTAVLFLMMPVAAAALGRIDGWVPAAYTVMSCLSFVVYAGDKRRSRQNGRRTPENTLHLIDLLGGWPGGLAARGMLRHKTRKPVFRAVAAMIIALHLGGWAWFLIGAPPVEVVRNWLAAIA